MTSIGRQTWAALEIGRLFLWEGSAIDYLEYPGITLCERTYQNTEEVT